MRDELIRIGHRAGLAAVGITTALPFEEARVVLESQKSQGLHATMDFTYRNPERSTTPTRILASAQSLIVGAWPYARPEPGEDASAHAARAEGHVAAYAWRDHYRDLRNALGAIADKLRGDGYEARVVADDNALVDRAAAVRAGLGWAGKNSNVLIPGMGSWFVLGSVVTDAALEPDHPLPDGCGPCVRCIDGCPTGAIVAPGVVDARRCLAWLVQADGDFPLEFREALGTRIYGCDDCQIVCPPGRNAPSELVGDEVAVHDLCDLLTMSNEQLEAAIGRWYIAKRDFDHVRRNALVALGNATISADDRRRIAEVLETYNDRGPMLSEHASWAGARLGLEP